MFVIARKIDLTGIAAESAAEKCEILYPNIARRIKG